MERFFWICLGGAVGTGARYLISTAALKLFGPSFPFGTLAVNLLGSFLLGGIMHIGLTSEVMSPTLRLAITAGVLGGLTTYSTFSHDTMRLLLDGAWSSAVLNVVITVTAGLAATFLGLAAGRSLVGS